VGIRNIGTKISDAAKLRFYIRTKGMTHHDILTPSGVWKDSFCKRTPWFHSLKDV